MTDDSQRSYRDTKIIATLGPATQSDRCIEQLINRGVDVFRLNMAQGSSEWAFDITNRIREASSRVGRKVAVMMDVKGPEIRTGVVDEPIELSAGTRLHLRTAPVAVPAGPPELCFRDTSELCFRAVASELPVYPQTSTVHKH